MKRKTFLLSLLLSSFFAESSAQAVGVLVEAESFAQRGGWKLDTQFINEMGSPYLLAHGLGKPVEDAMTEAVIPVSGEYRVWVRTKDWVARWRYSILFIAARIASDGSTPIPGVFGRV